MQITRQADYALRAMHFLSQMAPREKAATSQIAEEMLIPPSFLAKIISQLSISDLISTSRGAKGGVSLKRSANEISVLEVVEAIDGPILLNDCTGDIADCPFGEECMIRPLWCEAQAELVAKLRNTKLDQLAGKQKQG